MDIKTLKAKLDDPIVRDKMVIRAAVERLRTLPLSACYCDGYTVNGEPQRTVRLNEIACRMGFRSKDGLPATLGELLQTYLERGRSDDIVMTDLAWMCVGFLPEREEAHP